MGKHTDSLGKRMKAYESIPKISLMAKTPVIIRIDGKAFHTFTRGFNQPFDEVLMNSMTETCKDLCSEISGCKFAYTQSDEISLLLSDWSTPQTQGWFEYQLEKLVSICASIATRAFNRAFYNQFVNYANTMHFVHKDSEESIAKLINTYHSRVNMALFDARAFNLPPHEVVNYFIWRQQDAVRNSIQMFGQAHFSHKQLLNKNTSMIQDMLMETYGINWNDLDVPKKRGACIVKQYYDKNGSIRSHWEVDTNIPIFTQDREYINKFVDMEDI